MRPLIWFGLVLGLPLTAAAQAGPTAEDINKSNNPLAPALGVNLQDYHAPSYYGLTDSDANTFLLRGVVPHQVTRLAAASPHDRANRDLAR
jgi:hypothetical protein